MQMTCEDQQIPEPHGDGAHKDYRVRCPGAGLGLHKSAGSDGVEHPKLKAGGTIVLV